MRTLLVVAVLALVSACQAGGLTIAGVYAGIEAAADWTHEACGNTEPGGSCAAGSWMQTDQKERIARALQDAQNKNNAAKEAYAAAYRATCAANLTSDECAAVRASNHRNAEVLMAEARALLGSVERYMWHLEAER